MEKDIIEKKLAEYKDVFADIINGLLFHGENVVLPDELEDKGTISQYKADDSKVHQQERDVCKRWNGADIAVFGFENQSTIDKNMPARIIGYDGASYRAQLLKRDSKEQLSAGA